MTTLTIANVPDEVVRQLEADAQLHHRTVEDEARVRLGARRRKATEEVERLLEEARRSREALTASPLTEEFLEYAKNWGRP